MLWPILILDRNNRSLRRRRNNYNRKPRKVEATTIKLYKKVKRLYEEVNGKSEVLQKVKKSNEEVKGKSEKVKHLHQTEEMTKKKKQINRKGGGGG